MLFPLSYRFAKIVRRHAFKILGTLLLLLIISSVSFAQGTIKGKVVDAATRQPLEGATVHLLPDNRILITDQAGNFQFNQLKQKPEKLVCSLIGYGNMALSIGAFDSTSHIINLSAQNIELSAITVTAHAGEPFKPISRTDIAMRGVSISQEVLRIVPGLVIGQHQGGGKAEQIFLRGFDCDHGTDLRLEADGLPINMVSHAHGQGFADSHFIIPETIVSVDYRKGSYTASKGDFSTTGFVDFNTKNVLSNNLVKLEGGMFDTYRLLGVFNLLSDKAMKREQSWYAASEYRYSNGYFDKPQHFKRFNFFTKYSGKLSAHQYLTVSASQFWSQWKASGQIPERAVKEGIIDYFGTLDPNEGGITYRTNLNVQLSSTLSNGDLIRNQLYYSNYHFDLHSNFTFFLHDSVNGDEIRQQQGRNMIGYNGSYQHMAYAGKLQFTTEAGLNFRADLVKNSLLSHTVDRYTLLQQVKLGDITEWGIAPYFSETIRINDHLSMNAGLRIDQYSHVYGNKLDSDTTLKGTGLYKAHAHTLSPKLNIYYTVNDNLQLYINSGKGFHSNDTRAVVVEKGVQVLPADYGVDLGAVLKPFKNMIINAAVWYNTLDQEFVYGGDGGTIEFNGKTKRKGFDFSARYEPFKAVYVDMDLNYAHGRAVEAFKGQDYIPLAPVWTSSAGVTYASKKGINGSLRYRYVGDRPANEDYSLKAEGYFITDAVLNYSKSHYEIGLVINNIFNTRWKETQFATETRLKGEPRPVEEICFTPGTPFAATLSFSIKF